MYLWMTSKRVKTISPFQGSRQTIERKRTGPSSPVCFHLAPSDGEQAFCPTFLLLDDQSCPSIIKAVIAGQCTRLLEQASVIAERAASEDIRLLTLDDPLYPVTAKVVPAARLSTVGL